MERHFRRATLITVYKLFHGYMNLPAEEFSEAPAVGNLREHNFKVRQPRFHLAKRKNKRLRLKRTRANLGFVSGRTLDNWINMYDYEIQSITLFIVQNLYL